ncbi:MAG: hypothetical protein RugAbin2_02383 [Rugosibacter sp.]|nr:hypothetical protein [Rugosibacter sp.]
MCPPRPSALLPTAGFAQPAGCGGWLCKAGAGVANSRPLPSFPRGEAAIRPAAPDGTAHLPKPFTLITLPDATDALRYLISIKALCSGHLGPPCRIQSNSALHTLIDLL